MQAVMDFYAEDAEFETPTMRLRGRDAISGFYQEMFATFSQIDVVPTSRLEQGDSIALEYQCRLVRKSGEVRVAHGISRFTIKDGRIQRLRGYFNPADF